MRPSLVRSNSAPQASSSRTRSGASWAWSWAMRQLLRSLPPRMVSRKCTFQLSSEWTLPMAAAMPPSAITVWALPSRDLQTTAVRRPMAWASTAARRPAPPAPMMTTSNSWVSYSVMFSSSLDMEAVVVDGPTGHQSHVQVGEGHEEEAHPCEEHVLPVEGGERLPELVADWRLGELLHPAAAQVPAGVAAEGVEPQQRGVDTQDGRADADPDPEARLAEGLDGVDGQDDVEDEAEVEEVPVDVLEEQREPGLSGVGAVAVGHRAGRRGQPERPVVRLAVVVAGHPEAQREDQDEQGGGDRPPRDHGVPGWLPGTQLSVRQG